MSTASPDPASDPLRLQYERLPYPPVPWVALPARGQGRPLRYEHGLRLAGAAGTGVGAGAAGSASHVGIRILVAGCGTFEPLVVGQMHPLSREVVAMDFSERSLQVLRRRLRFARWLARATAGIMGRRLPPVRVVRADLLGSELESERFDYILASNVLHHLPDPALGLRALSARLAPGGLMRVVTYPARSRLWVRATGAWLRARGLSAGSPRLVASARAAIAELPEGHPFRSAFKSHPEAGTRAGLVDAFLNARENPLNPLEWEGAARAAGLELVAEDQDEGSRGSFLEEMLPETRVLTRWEKLQALDDLLELCANPVFWFRKTGDESSRKHAEPRVPPAEPGRSVPAAPATLEAALAEASAGLRRAIGLLARAGVTADRLRAALESHAGPRVGRDGRPLPGLSLLDYAWGAPGDAGALSPPPRTQAPAGI